MSLGRVVLHGLLPAVAAGWTGPRRAPLAGRLLLGRLDGVGGGAGLAVALARRAPLHCAYDRARDSHGCRGAAARAGAAGRRDDVGASGQLARSGRRYWPCAAIRRVVALSDRAAGGDTPACNRVVGLAYAGFLQCRADARRDSLAAARELSAHRAVVLVVAAARQSARARLRRGGLLFVRDRASQWSAGHPADAVAPSLVPGTNAGRGTV